MNRLSSSRLAADATVSISTPCPSGMLNRPFANARISSCSSCGSRASNCLTTRVMAAISPTCCIEISFISVFPLRRPRSEGGAGSTPRGAKSAKRRIVPYHPATKPIGTSQLKPLGALTACPAIRFTFRVLRLCRKAILATLASARGHSPERQVMSCENDRQG